jgi:hypothetical protein
MTAQGARQMPRNSSGQVSFAPARSPAAGREEMEMNTPLDLPQMPAELAELLKDPRLEGMVEGLPGLPATRRKLDPHDPPVAGESPFLLMRGTYENTFGDVRWLNEPSGLSLVLRNGDGKGFPSITERPRFEERKKKPKNRADAWAYLSWLIASPAFIGIVRRFDADAIEAVEIDWTFSDGSKLDGYAFVDVRRRVDAYDYRRSEVWVELRGGQKCLAELGHPRALKPGIQTGIHIFRDNYFRSDIFVSRALARALAEGGMRGIRFEDPVSVDTVQF